MLPEVIFTDPQVASVGLTEEQAKAEGYDVKVAKLPLPYVPKALTAHDTRGLITLIADRTSDMLSTNDADQPRSSFARNTI